MKTGLVKPATGWGPDSLPFFENLDPGQFEEFCAALLNLCPKVPTNRNGRRLDRHVVDAARLLSGNDQRGADLRVNVDQGEVWMVQCKRVASFGPKEVRESVRLLEDGFPQADAYVLCTTCGLSTEAQEFLWARPRWLWWDSARLTGLVQSIQPQENAIKLVHRFFGEDWVRRLFPWPDQPLLTAAEFFADPLSEERRQWHHGGSYLERSGEMDRLDDHALAGSGRVLLLSAAGGQGKSRLLLEWARRSEGTQGFPRIRFLNLRRDGLTDTQADFLGRQVEENLVLVIEDGHRMDSVIGELARLLRGSKQLRLIIATRPQAIEALRAQLVQNGYSERIDGPAMIDDWSKAELIRLAENQLSPGRSHFAPPLVDLSDRCPLLVILGAAQINAGSAPVTLLNTTAFRERVLADFVDAFLRRVPELARTRVRRLIQVLSCLSPVLWDDPVRTRVAELLEVTEWDVEEDLGQLRAGGLVVENREGLRIYPDLLADAVVVDALASRTGPGAFLGRAVIEKLPFQDYPALLRNLAQADWEYRQRHGPGESIFDVVWSRFLHLFDSVSVDERGRMLDRWAGLAVFQPERTLELARHALNASTGTTEGEGESAPRFSDTGRLGRIVAILEPIATWHQHFAGEALDLLWTIARRSPAVTNRDDRHPITAIARAASFQVGKPVSASEGVLSWLEKALADVGSIGWFRNQPWIIGALLSPFFGRVVEQQWTTGMTFHLRDIPIDATRTRSTRLRALQLVERLLNLPDLKIFGGTIPVLEVALRAPGPARGFERWDWAFDDWRRDRIEALDVAARFLKSHPKNVVELLRVNRAVVWYGVHDGDNEFREAIKGLKGCFPDQLEYRLALALSEGEQLEFVDIDETKRGRDDAAIEARKSEFVGAVASEVFRSYDGPDKFLRDLRRLVHDLRAAGISVGGRPLMAAIAAASGEWRDALLEAILKASDGVLDRLLFPLLDKARQVPSSIYTSVLNAIPMTWSRGPTEAWVDLISWVIRKGKVLLEAERGFIDALAERPEDWIASVLSRFAFRVADKDAPWAVAILKRLRPKDDESREWYLMALSELTKQQEGIADLDLSENLRAFDLSKANGSPAIENAFQVIAQRHPMVVFRVFRENEERTEDAADLDETTRDPIAIPALGHVEDRVLLETELRALWRSAVECEEGRLVRVSLARALVGANPEAVLAILEQFIRECRSADDLVVLAEIMAPGGSRFVFSHPDHVRAFIARATELSGREPVTRVLQVSAVGGGRGWTGGGLDPEYRYILDQAKLLANRHKGDPALGEFYAGIVRYEEATEAEHRAWYVQAHRDG